MALSREDMLHNERVKLAATAFNTLATSAVAAGVLTQLAAAALAGAGHVPANLRIGVVS